MYKVGNSIALTFDLIYGQPHIVESTIFHNFNEISSAYN